MSTIISDTIRIAESYASIRGDTEPTGQDYMSAAVAAGERPAMIRATAEIAACERLNREANVPESLDARHTRQADAAARAAGEGATARRHAAALRANAEFPGRANKAQRDARIEELLR